MDSIWKSTASRKSFPRLEKNLRTDVLIIGGGIAGILAAYMLDRAGVDCCLLEADTVCSGVTLGTTAKITSQHGLIYSRLYREFGALVAKLYYQANEDAAAEYERMCRDIDCDHVKRDSYVYSTRNMKALREEVAVCDKIGIPAELLVGADIPFDAVGAVKFRDQAQFDPLKFLFFAASGLHIYEHTPVREIIGNTAICGGVKVTANKIIVATHFPFINKHGAYFMKLYQERSYVIAIEGAPDIGGMYADETTGGLSFRSCGKYLLIGGGDRRTGKKGAGWRELAGFAEKNYPGCHIKYKWATQDCMTLDGVPYIGRYGAMTDGLYVTTGYNKWGMTSAMASAKLLKDMITGVENPYAKLFSPSRTMLRRQLFINIGESAHNLISPSSKRCPHLGCALKWNKIERTWDCPCHGSRFTSDGKCIDNPATGDIKAK